MNERTLDILDQSLTFSLWTFLVAFIVVLLFVNQRLRARKQGLMDYLREKDESLYEQHFEEQSPGAQPNDVFRLLSHRTRMVFQALVLSTGIALLVFILASFLPIAGLDNFASSTPSKSTPLRVASLHYDRFHEGFSLLGEVWNQTQEPISGLRAVISIWQSDQELLDTVSVPVVPDPVAGGSAGTFSLRYEKRSPLLYGYRLAFEDWEGKTISHLEGFDVE